jgi:hypothetical protein
MKKLAAIPLIILILFTGINISIATHYCGGNFAGSRVSLSDKTADCGMNPEADKNSSSESLRKHCCENVLTSVTVCKNYFPESVSSIPQYFPLTTDVNATLSDHISDEFAGFSTHTITISPPGRYSQRSVEQQSICVFLI